jgi:pimeloyl-ACP methyl ester carboxylesterase
MALSDYKHRTLPVRDVALHVVEAGVGAPVILIHGFPQHWWMWRRLMTDLAAAGFRAIAYDQRGMGGSSIPAGGYGKASLAADLAGLMVALDIPEANVIGYDHGGGTALAFAYDNPARCTRLGVIEYAPPGYGYEYGMQPVPDWQAWQLAFFTQPDIAVHFIAGRERELLAWYFWHWSDNPDAVGMDDFEVYLRQLQKPGALRGGFMHFASVFEDMETFKGHADKRLAMPLLGLGGARGAGAYVQGALQRMGDHVSGGIVEGAGHWIADEAPEALTDAVVTCLRS